MDSSTGNRIFILILFINSFFLNGSFTNSKLIERSIQNSKRNKVSYFEIDSSLNVNPISNKNRFTPFITNLQKKCGKHVKIQGVYYISQFEAIKDTNWIKKCAQKIISIHVIGSKKSVNSSLVPKKFRNCEDKLIETRNWQISGTSYFFNWFEEEQVLTLNLLKFKKRTSNY